MYSESDLDSAVASGALTPEAAKALRQHAAMLRSAPAVDEEHFRLITGFNDIFVSVAIVLLLVALGWIGGNWSAALGGALIAGASWMLAEFFTRRRRMALPSILLLLAFVGGVAGTLVGAMVDVQSEFADRIDALIAAGIGLATAGAAWVHWRRFHVPITVAAGAVASTGVVMALLLAAAPAIGEAINWLVLACGLAVFALAMWWDTSDRARQTRRSDVAFWLHLAAAPMIAHPIFHALGVVEGSVSTIQALAVILLYVAFAGVSLAIDRRALLVSSLAYVLYALASLFEQAGVVTLSVAFTALVIGSALLLLSAFWHVARRRVVALLPADVQARVPDIAGLSPQPAS